MSSIAPIRHLSGLLSSFPIRMLSSATDNLYENEILIIVRNMAGVDHIAAIDACQLSGTLYLFAGHVCNVYHELVHLSINYETFDYNVSMMELRPLLEKTNNIIHVLVKNPPSVIPSFMSHDILNLKRLNKCW